MSITNLLIGIFNKNFLDYTITSLIIGELSNPLQNAEYYQNEKS